MCLLWVILVIYLKVFIVCLIDTEYVMQYKSLRHLSDKGVMSSIYVLAVFAFDH